jgi:hypothetical protein
MLTGKIMSEMESRRQIKPKSSKIQYSRPYSKSSLTLNEWKFNLSFSRVFFCVGVMYSGEYDACDVTLSVYPHRAGFSRVLLLFLNSWRISAVPYYATTHHPAIQK